MGLELRTANKPITMGLGIERHALFALWEESEMGSMCSLSRNFLVILGSQIAYFGAHEDPSKQWRIQQARVDHVASFRPHRSH